MEQKTLNATGISKKYKDTVALHPTTLCIEQGKIYGLIGRNGAGKTTLLSLITAQNPVSTGTVTYGGQPVWENEKVIGELCFSREISAGIYNAAFKGKHFLKIARCYYPYWDEAYAQRLIQEFGLDMKKKLATYSKGMLSMLTITLGLASRAPITMMDEPVAGLDVPMRDRFYQLLLDDYQKTGRTFIISTHIIEEAASLMEEIILLDKGVMIEKANTEEYLANFRYISGRDEIVDAAAEGLEVVHTECMGRHKQVCVRANTAEITRRIAGQALDVTPVPLQKVFVYVTGGEKGANIA